jgi:DNA-directed RNA polymerase specialized sigma24 family protein
MLPAIFQEASKLRSFYRLQYQEVGAILGVPEGTIKNRIHRGRWVLARLLSRRNSI